MLPVLLLMQRRRELAARTKQAAKRNELRMAGGAAVPAVAEPAGGAAHRHITGGDRRGSGRDHSGDRAFDEHGISPGHPRSAAERYRAHKPEADWPERNPRLS